MRLDHLLSKENEIQGHTPVSKGSRLELLFNFEGFGSGRRDREELTREEAVGTKNGGVAQLGEHLPCKQGVMGSNPIISTRMVKDEGEAPSANTRAHSSAG